MFKLSGMLKVKNDTVQVSEKFSKREFVLLDDSGMYPQDILFQLAQDKCSLIDLVNVNDRIDVSFNLRGREWTSPQGEVKYFNTCEAWRIEKAAALTGTPTAKLPDNIPANTTPDDSDDLPF